MSIRVIKNKVCARVCVGEELGHSVSYPFEGLEAAFRSQDEKREEKLDDDSPVDGMPVHLNEISVILLYQSLFSQ